MKPWRPWVRAEIMIVRQCAGSMTVDRIGQLIGRTGAAVRTKARELGVKMYLRGQFHQSIKYPASDVQLSRELHEAGMSAGEIAAKLDIPAGAVKQFIYFETRAFL